MRMRSRSSIIIGGRIKIPIHPGRIPRRELAARGLGSARRRYAPSVTAAKAAVQGRWSTAWRLGTGIRRYDIQSESVMPMKIGIQGPTTRCPPGYRISRAQHFRHSGESRCPGTAVRRLAPGYRLSRAQHVRHSGESRCPGTTMRHLAPGYRLPPVRRWRIGRRICSTNGVVSAVWSD
jgi:hypothetical protein